MKIISDDVFKYLMYIKQKTNKKFAATLFEFNLFADYDL